MPDCRLCQRTYKPAQMPWLVLAQLPICAKENEITAIPKLLEYLNIQESVITTDALGTQTSVMEQILYQGGHFVMMVKRNQPQSYQEIIDTFSAFEEDRKRAAENPGYQSLYPEWKEKYDEVSLFEKNRDRYEYRDYKVIHDASRVSKTEKEWTFLKSIRCAEQTRIRLVRNEKGEDITPNRETFQREGSFLQCAFFVELRRWRGKIEISHFESP